MPTEIPRPIGYWFGISVSFRSEAAYDSYLNKFDRASVVMESRPSLVDFSAEDVQRFREDVSQGLLRFHVRGGSIQDPATLFYFTKRDPDGSISHPT